LGFVSGCFVCLGGGWFVDRGGKGRSVWVCIWYKIARYWRRNRMGQDIYSYLFIPVNINILSYSSPYPLRTRRYDPIRRQVKRNRERNQYAIAKYHHNHFSSQHTHLIPPLLPSPRPPTAVQQVYPRDLASCPRAQRLARPRACAPTRLSCPRAHSAGCAARA
jgi:hypothetical protein